MRTYGKLAYQDQHWIIEAEPHVMMRLRRLFSRLKTTSGSVRLNDTEEICRDLLWFMERYPLVVSGDDKVRLEARAFSYDERNEYFATVLNSGTQRHFELAVPARDYQKVAADLALKMKGLLLADTMGLGKTCSAICTLTEPATLPVAIVTLTHLPTQWQREIGRFAPNLRVHVAKKGTPDFPKDKEFDVYILSYSKLSGWANTLAGKVKSIIFDEVQELRKDGSAKYGGALKIAEQCEYRLGLSGTPIYNYGGEFHNVINILRPDVLGSRSEFLKEWCSGYFDPDKARISDPKAFGTYLRENGIMLRRTRKDVGRELPPMSRVEHYVDCDSKALESVRNSVTELAKFILSKQGDRFERMRASGDLDWRLRQATGIAKAPYVAEFVKMVAESGEKVVVYTWHHMVQDILMDRLKDYNPVKYTGKESPTQKEAAKKAFCEGDSKVLIMSLRAGAGLDGLQFVCNTVVFAELDWSAGVHEQCEARLDRDGQETPVIAYYLVSDEGSDPIISDVLGIKKGQLQGVINPEQELIEKLSDVALDGVKRLAEEVLKQRGIDLTSIVPV
jgi:SNF2 family DNA or RNA helicase